MLSGLVVVRVAEPGVVLVEDPLLWVGPQADDDVIATIACRRAVRAEGRAGEDAVRERVELEGYAYRLEPANDVSTGMVKASPRSAQAGSARTVG